MNDETKTAIVFVTTVALIGGLMYGLYSAVVESPEEQKQIYTAWSVIHPEIKVSQGDFQALRDAGLLPGQAPTGDDCTALAAIANVNATIAATRR